MPYKFCPKCAHELTQIMEEGHPQLACPSCGFVFYRNSKPTSSALIMCENRVLLGRRKNEPFKGLWDIPGGFLEPGEHPEGGMRREVREETNLEVEIIDLLGFFMDSYGEDDTTLNIGYIARVKSGEPKPGDDLTELQWFDLNQLPEDLSFQNGKDMLAALKLWYKNSDESSVE